MKKLKHLKSFENIDYYDDEDIDYRRKEMDDLRGVSNEFGDEEESDLLYPALEFLASLNNDEIDKLTETLYDTDDLDERFDIVDSILSIIEEEYEEYYIEYEDEIKDLAIS